MVENSKSQINNLAYGYTLIDSKNLSEFIQFFDSENEIEKIVNEYKIKSISEINSNLLNKIRLTKKTMD